MRDFSKKYPGSIFAIAFLLLSLSDAANAQTCAEAISTQKSMGACNNNDFGYTTTVANQCPTWINVYLTDSTGFEHIQSIAPNSTNKIYDCSAPTKLTAWCYRYDSRKCDKQATRRPIAKRNSKELILESYGRIVTLTQELSNQGIDHPNIFKYIHDAQGALDRFNSSSALSTMRNIESEIKRFYQQVSDAAQLAQKTPDLRYIRYVPTINYEKVVSPFLGRWSRIRSQPVCSAITELKSVLPVRKDETTNNPVPKIVVAMYRDGSKILESEYQPRETHPGRLDLGKGGIVSVHHNHLRWNHGNATSEYVRCP